jgi:hypothetical protein
VGYFLNQVDPKRWERFLRGEDDTWGFAEGRRRMAEKRLQRGALLICLLIKHHRLQPRWCGVLEVVGGLLPPDDLSVTSDSALPVRFPVEKIVALPVEQALSVFDRSVWHDLARTKKFERDDPLWFGKAGLRGDLTNLGADDGAILVSRLLARAQYVPLPYDADADADPDPDPAAAAPATARRMRQIIERRGQQAFRDGLLRAYGGRCAITCCDIVDVLEAAHITPFSELGSDDVTNGLLLRADLHTLFDCYLIGVDPSGPGGRTVVVADRLRASEYGPLHERRIRDPGPGKAPSEEALRRRMERMRSLGLIAE